MNTTGVVLFAKKRDIVDGVHAQFRCAGGWGQAVQLGAAVCRHRMQCNCTCRALLPLLCHWTDK